MSRRINLSYLFCLLIIFSLSFFTFVSGQTYSENLQMPSNVLDYTSDPDSPKYRKSLAFSDQGAWLAYGFSAKPKGGFSGPFLMTQENGVWSADELSKLNLVDPKTGKSIDFGGFTTSQSSYNSHLEQTFENAKLKITQVLFYSSPHTALIITTITNLREETASFEPTWNGATFLVGLKLKKLGRTISISSDKSLAKGYIRSLDTGSIAAQTNDKSYSIKLEPLSLKPGETKRLLLSHTFIFPEYNESKELKDVRNLPQNYEKSFQKRVSEKQNQIVNLYRNLNPKWRKPVYKRLLSKTVLTLQNNWRIPAGELKHSGVFPSYHYIWFHGFWAWDSWKHAAALAQYDTELAKDQIQAMYDFMDDQGFIADVVYRDTSIEAHNFRNTKPPLSGWAAWKVFQKDKDSKFLEEIYPKIVQQHRWWYANRDHDKDGVCEYGSTDGTLKAAKWESGMDNAVRFDDSKILKNSETAYSLDQESVDLNSYLYAEKTYLAKIARVIGKAKDSKVFEREAKILKTKIQTQFFDQNAGWFYDTSLDGKTFVKDMGCEGWIPLWANVATDKQAEAVKTNMMKPDQFNTKVPFQTLSANHPKFKPDRGYWRGPTWLDQAYFGVKGLRNYGYKSDADAATYRLIHNAEGVLEQGKSIRENYHPITGEGMESESFSWSAAHYLLLLVNE